MRKIVASIIVGLLVLNAINVNLELGKVKKLSINTATAYDSVVNRLTDFNSAYSELRATLYGVATDADNAISDLKDDMARKTVIRPSYEDLKSHCVYIRGEVDGTKWLGTGFVIANDRNSATIVTNAHVAGGDQSATTKLTIENGDTFVEATFVAKHPSEDIAILYVDRGLTGKTAISGFAYPSISEPVFIVGHHLGKKYTYGEGVWAGYAPGCGIVQIPALYGNSGSAVYNAAGKVVGIVFAIEVYSEAGDVDTTHACVIDSITLVNFINKIIPNYAKIN
jgi:S1-C subfamily serine protease